MVTSALALRFNTPMGVDLATVYPGRNYGFNRHTTEAEHPTLSECETQLADVLERRMRPMISAVGVQYPKANFRQLINAYAEAWSLLEQFKADWFSLLDNVIVIDANVVGEDRYHFAARESKRTSVNTKHEILGQLLWPQQVIFSAADAQLSLLPLSKAQQILVNDLERKITGIAAGMTGHLTQLVERHVIGLVEWYGRNACKYMYFEQSVDSREFPEEDAFDLGLAWRTTHVHGESRSMLYWHIHDLIDAIEVLPQNATTEVPANRRPILDAVPKWISGDVKIIQGSLIRDIRLHEVLATESWVCSFSEAVKCLSDPAIVLGPYVLTGWRGPESNPVVENPVTFSAAAKERIRNFFTWAESKL